MLKNILVDEMPFAIKVNGIQFILRTDFRLWIQAGEILQKLGKNGELIKKYTKEENYDRIAEKIDEKNELLVDLCNLVIEEYPTDGYVVGDDLLYGLLDFYKGFPREDNVYTRKKKEKKNDKKNDEKDKQQFSFEFDASYIYCSFASFYNIRLQTVEHMHWWEFLELFNGLMMSDSTSVNFVIGTRQQKIKSNMPKAEKERLQKLKKQFELPQDEDTTKAENKTLDILKAGKRNGTRNTNSN